MALSCYLFCWSVQGALFVLLAPVAVAGSLRPVLMGANQLARVKHFMGTVSPFSGNGYETTTMYYSDQLFRGLRH